jgi:hypothetical protein
VVAAVAACGCGRLERQVVAAAALGAALALALVVVEEAGAAGPTRAECTDSAAEEVGAKEELGSTGVMPVPVEEVAASDKRSRWEVAAEPRLAEGQAAKAMAPPLSHPQTGPEAVQAAAHAAAAAADAAADAADVAAAWWPP